jgi:hypothetical protein
MAIPKLNAFWRIAPGVRFIAFEILTTGVLLFECTLRSRTCSFVQATRLVRLAIKFILFERCSLAHRQVMTNIQSTELYRPTTDNSAPTPPALFHNLSFCESSIRILFLANGTRSISASFQSHQSGVSRLLAIAIDPSQRDRNYSIKLEPKFAVQRLLICCHEPSARIAASPSSSRASSSVLWPFGTATASCCSANMARGTVTRPAYS